MWRGLIVAQCLAVMLTIIRAPLALGIEPQENKDYTKPPPPPPPEKKVVKAHRQSARCFLPTPILPIGGAIGQVLWYYAWRWSKDV